MRGKDGRSWEFKYRFTVIVGMAALLASCRTASVAPNAMLLREPLRTDGNGSKPSDQASADFGHRGSARVQALRGGRAEYQPAGGQWQALRVGTVLSSGDRVRSGPQATVDLWLKDSYSLVRLSPGTTLALETLRFQVVERRTIPQTILRLDQGRIAVGLRPQVAGAVYEIRTPKAVYRARANRGASGSPFQSAAEGHLKMMERVVETLQANQWSEVSTGGVVLVR